MADEITPLENHYGLLNAKDEVALDLLAAVYAFMPNGDSILEQMRKRKLTHDWGSGPIADAAQAHAEADLDRFRERIAEIRASIRP